MLLPPEATLKSGALHVVEQEVEECITFRDGESKDLGGEHRVHIEALSPRHGMGSNHRMFALRVDLPRVVAPDHRVHALVVRSTVVDRGEALEHLLHSLGQGFVSGVHAGKHRVTAAFRDGKHPQDRSHGGLFTAGHIGVPHLPRYAL